MVQLIGLCGYVVVIFWQLSNSLLCWAFLVKSLSDECPINLPTLVQIMTWCHQALSHYLSKCWPWSLSLYDVPNEWSILKILLVLFHLLIILWFYFLHMMRQLSCHDISKNVVLIGSSFPISEEHIFYMQTFFFINLNKHTCIKVTKVSPVHSIEPGGKQWQHCIWGWNNYIDICRG